MIKILNNSKELLAIIKDSYNPWRFEEINGGNTLSFNAVLTEKVSNYVNENNIVELEDDYFDIAYYSKDMNEDGTATMSVECEHVSYRLNDPLFNMDYFTETGTPNYILGRILADTGFKVGTVEFAGNITYSAQEKKSRRRLLMEFIALLGGEVDFDKFTISILQRKGSTDLQIFTRGKNIKVINKIYNGREDTPIVAYTCTPIILSNKNIGLGDDVLLIQPELGIQDNLRVVRHSYNPYDNMLAEIEIANYINGLEDQLYRIETSTVAKEKIYNGCRIGPDEGFVAERSDLKAKTIMNATEGISIYSDVGQGLERNFFVDLDGRIQAKGLDISGDATFKGAITASTIDIGNGTFTVDIDGNMVAMSGTFGGTISTSQNAEIGNNIYLGDMSSNNSKGIYFSTGSYSSEITLDSRGKLEIFNWTDLDISSSENINIGTTEQIEILGNIVDISCWGGGAVILDEETYIGYKDSPGDNLVATLYEIEAAIEAHITEYH